MRRLSTALFSCVLVLLAGCGGSDTNNVLAAGTSQAATGDCSVSGENRQIQSVMQDWYYWYRNLSAADPGSYGNAESFVEALRYQPLDRFSFVTSQAANQAFYSAGQYVGFGFSQQLDSNSKLRISDVYPGSPAAGAGILRGDTVLAVNGVAVSTLLAQGTLDSAYGDTQVGVKATLQFQHPAGDIHTATLSKAVVTQPNVSRLKVFTDGSHTVGYFFFQNFIQPSDAELDQAFAQLKADAVDELVIDDRYNGGGLLSVAQHLGSLIAGSSEVGQPFATLNYNDRHPNYNYTFNFEPETNALGLNRVVFITTAASASAAELIINALKPYMDVVTVGSTTFGKPVGENGFDICKDVLYPMTFKMTNAAGFGDYFDGFAPTCPAVDDLSHALGDSGESSLATALYYIANGNCGPHAFAAARTLSEHAAQTPVPRTYGWRQLVN
ncbi:MAG TPA: S41 family peptidase, partial [Gammaproteobacteria bacterium]|nr:S41 family peptidase [Gammaproteobacteria bacterium]